MTKFNNRDDFLDALYDHVFPEDGDEPDDDWFNHLADFFNDDNNSGGNSGDNSGGNSGGNSNAPRRRRRQQSSGGSGNASRRRSRQTSSNDYGNSRWFG